jgi:hypothetical protein
MKRENRHSKRMDPGKPSRTAIRTSLQGESAAETHPTYIIKAGQRIVWEGENPQTVWPRIRDDFPSEKLSIVWKMPSEFLIV